MDHQIGGLKPLSGDDEHLRSTSMRQGAFVYMLTNRPNGTLYVGVTNDLVRRVYEHREGAVGGFTKRYKLKSLVYYEQHATMPLAIQREKNIKHWSRAWKVDLIRALNPEWRDLYPEITT